MVRELGFFRTFYEDTGVTSAQAHILMELETKQALNLTEIIDRVRMDKSSASRTVNRLIGMKLVKQRFLSEDRRNKIFELTANGRSKAKQIDATSTEIVNRALSLLPQKDRESIFVGIGRYAGALREARLRREYTVRQLRAEDNLAIAKVIKTILKNEFQESEAEIMQMLPELRDLSTFYKRDRSKYFVVVEGNKVKGGGGIAPLSFGTSNLCELQKMYLAKSLRGKGLGERLLVECLAFARAAGYSGVYLDTRDVMTAAEALYQKYGFKKLTKPLARTGHFICDSYYLLKF